MGGDLCTVRPQRRPPRNAPRGITLPSYFSSLVLISFQLTCRLLSFFNLYQMLIMFVTEAVLSLRSYPEHPVRVQNPRNVLNLYTITVLSWSTKQIQFLSLNSLQQAGYRTLSDCSTVLLSLRLASVASDLCSLFFLPFVSMPQTEKNPFNKSSGCRRCQNV